MTAAAAGGIDAAPPRASRVGRRIGAAPLAAVIAFATFGGWLTDADPARQDLARILEPPSLEHPLGTDHFGRSMLSRTVAATRLSLGLALICVAIAAATGTALGLAAAWRGGWTDRALSALADAVLALPGLLLVLLVAALAPGAYWPLYAGVSLVLWVEHFRVVRASAASLVASPQVEASLLLGFGPGYVVRTHLLPELAPLVGTLAAFGAAAAVMALAALGFVNVGLRPPTPEWGIMMTELLPYHREAPWLIATPIVLLVATVLGLALIAGRDPR